MEVSAVLIVVTGQYQIRAPVTIPDASMKWTPPLRFTHSSVVRCEYIVKQKDLCGQNAPIIQTKSM